MLVTLYNKLSKIFHNLNPLMLLVIRLWIADVFFSSGMVKIEDFQNTVALFREEYKTPFLPPEIAAILATVFEIICPILLTLGLASRIATLPLLAMTLVIHLTYDQNQEHLYWAMLLGIILTGGAGKLSLDYLVAKKYNALNYGNTKKTNFQ